MFYGTRQTRHGIKKTAWIKAFAASTRCRVLIVDSTPAHEPDTAADRVSGYEPYVGFWTVNPTSGIGLVMPKTEGGVGFVGFRKREGDHDGTVGACPLH
jgi:hypothetical protein